MTTKTILTSLLWVVCLTSPLAADDWGPWEATTASQPSQTKKKRPNDGQSPLAGSVRFFQRYISPIDGPRCPMYPTCSAYSLQALEKHGPLFGTFLTVDRLYREGDPHEHAQTVIKYGYKRFADPLKANDFWLKTGEKGANSEHEPAHADAHQQADSDHRRHHAGATVGE